METSFAIIGLLAVIFGPVLALAFRSDRHWPRVRDGIWPTLAAICFGSLTFGFGAFVEGTLAKHEISVATPAFAICAGALSLLIALGAADWLRKP